MKPSFFKSTLSLAFILSISSVIVMIFLGTPVDDKLLSVLTGVIGAYIGSRVPNTTIE